MREQLRQWLKRHSWWAGGVGAVALVLLGGLSGAWFNSLFGGESIEDELNKRNLVAADELEVLRTQVVVAQGEVDALNGQLSVLETKTDQDRAISQREFITDVFRRLSPTAANDPGLPKIADMHRGCNDELNTGNPATAIDCYEEVADRLRTFCGVAELSGSVRAEIAADSCGMAVLLAVPASAGPPPR